jgi:hypothetical protein
MGSIKEDPLAIQAINFLNGLGDKKPMLIISILQQGLFR